MKANKVVHLTSVHPFDDSRIFHKECRELVRAGYEVYLVACCANSRLFEGVNVVAVTAKNGRLKRMLSSAWHVYHQAMDLNADLYHLHDPELIPYAILLRFHGKKVVYDAHEDLPLQILSKRWIPGMLRRPLSGLAAFALRFGSRFVFSAVIAAEPPVEKKFPVSKTILVQNFPLLDELMKVDAQPYEERPNHVANIGGISRIRCIREIVKAIEHLSSADARLILGGKFESDSLYKDVSRYEGWSKVDFEGWMDRTQVRDTLNSVRAGLVLLYPEQTYIDAQPIKLFEYMSASLPVVASDFPLHKEIVEGSNCGLCVDPLSPEQIASAIQWLFDNAEEAKKMGENGRKAIEEKYNWDNEGGKLLELYKKLLSS